MLGLNAKKYRNSGTSSSPVWVEETWVKDLKVPIQFDKADSSTRGTGGTKTNEAALLDIPVSGNGLYLPAVTEFATILANAVSRTPMEFAFADGNISTTGTKYIRAYCTYFKFEEGQELEGNQTIDFELGPSNPVGTTFAAPTLNTT